MYLWASALAIGSAVAVFVNVRTGLVVAVGISALAVVDTRKPRRATA
jgi:hypothetical protein